MTRDVLAGLTAVCRDRVVTPRHPAYDGVRLLFNGMHDYRPRAICLPRDSGEVRAAIQVARASGLPTAVRGGGHNVAGLGSVEDGIVIDLRLINHVTVDRRRRRARVGGGATWLDFDLGTSTYGLACTGGTFDTTGVGGLTLGGGIGHLMGRCGLACDNVESYQVVTAQGEEITVDAATDPELNWALRGAGHNFGVATEFEFRLHPVRNVYGGFVAYAGSDAVAAVQLFRDLMLGAPDELTCTMLLERYGPTQGPAAVMSVCYSGNDAEYVRTLNKTLSAVDVADWQVRDRSYVSMQLCLGRLPFGLRHYWSARCVDSMPDELTEDIVDRFRAGTLTDPFNDTVLLEPINGAVRRGSQQTSAVPFRGAGFNVTGMAIWGPREADDEQIAWAKSVAAAAEPYGSFGDGYINYVCEAPSDGTARAVRTFGEAAFDRLVAVKRRLDPDNFFRSNYNITPRQ